MKIGISSACFYPLETEKSLKLVGEAGAKVTELFFNSPSELKKPFLNELIEIKNNYGMEIASVHPFMSFAEGFYIFSSYVRRFEDSLDMYSRFFEAAATLGAKLFVLHGSKEPSIAGAEYAQRLFQLGNRAKEFGVQIAHENVVHYVGQRPEFMLYLKEQLGNDFKMTLDIKQAKRANQDPFEFIRLLGNSIVHVHVSDNTRNHDCLPPGKGHVNFEHLFSSLNKTGYNGKYIIELYKHNFNGSEELTEAQEYLSALLQKVTHKKG